MTRSLGVRTEACLMLQHHESLPSQRREIPDRIVMDSSMRQVAIEDCGCEGHPLPTFQRQPRKAAHHGTFRGSQPPRPCNFSIIKHEKELGYKKGGEAVDLCRNAIGHPERENVSHRTDVEMPVEMKTTNKSIMPP